MSPTQDTHRIPHWGPGKVLPDSFLYTQRKPQGFLTPFLMPLLSVPRPATIPGHCTHSVLSSSANACKIWIIDKGNLGLQRGEMTHARSHGKEMAGPGFKPSSAAQKAYRSQKSLLSLPLRSNQDTLLPLTPTSSAKFLLPTPGQNEPLPPPLITLNTLFTYTGPLRCRELF